MSPATSSALQSHPTPDVDFFAAYSLDTLISGAARLRPQALALADRTAAVPFDLLAGQATALARLMMDCGLRPGDRILLTGGADASLVIAIIAALRGGFEPALAPLDLDASDLSAYARAINAAALAGPSDYGAPIAPETYLAAAASAPSIRFVATLGPQEIDGTVDFSTPAVLRYAAGRSDMSLDRREAFNAPRIITFDRGRKVPVVHNQATLMAAGLDFIALASVGRETPILSTLPPTSFAGLVTGPLAALLSGTTLYLEGPFEVESFLKRFDAIDHAHLILPRAVAADFAQAGLFRNLSSAVLLSRHSATATYQPAMPVPADCPLIDLYAIDEMAAVAEKRRGGMPVAPAQFPHYVGFDDSRILTVEAFPQPGLPLHCHGAAVTPIDV